MFRKPHVQELLTFLREARSPVDFAKLMQIRLAQTPLGPLVCPRRRTVALHVRSLGRDPVWVRSHTTDISVLHEVISGSYECAAKAIVSRSPTIIDLGANTGLAARWLSTRFAASTLICIEPAPQNVQILRRNMPDTVKIIHAFAGSYQGSAGLAGSREDAYRMRGQGDIPVVTMAEILARIDQVDLLKCDIEGAEEQLFADCETWIGRVDVLAVECHLPYGADQLLEGLSRARVNARILSLERTPQFGCEQLVARLS